MKPHPRIRKTVKWGGAAVTVLLLVVWIGSGWYLVSFTHGDYWVKVSSGCATLTHETRPLFGGQNGWHAESVVSPPPGYPGYQRWYWKPAYWRTYYPWETSWSVSLWAPSLAAGFFASIAWAAEILARRRARRWVHLCSNCRYDRTGLAAGAVCPECGRPPT